VSAKKRGAGKPRRGGGSQNSTVGYGRPPTASRFKPGISGNPKGRPKGAKNLKTLIKEAMLATISIQEGGKTTRVIRLVAVMLRQLQSALRGDGKSAITIFKIAQQLGILEDGGDPSEISFSREEQQILNELIKRSQKDE
jgi:hypothetical protein